MYILHQTLLFCLVGLVSLLAATASAHHIHHLFHEVGIGSASTFKNDSKNEKNIQ